VLQLQSRQFSQFSPRFESHTPLPHDDCCTHWPFWQAYPVWHDPHDPPHESSPQFLPLHCGLQQEPPLQTNPESHLQSRQLAQFSPAWQVPLPHSTRRTHVPCAEQSYPPPQEPHVPPHPSLPHVFPVQLGVQHTPAGVQLCDAPQGQSPAQLLQFSPVSQRLLPQKTSSTHLPWAHV
jgi:hypothetical protein